MENTAFISPSALPSSEVAPAASTKRLALYGTAWTAAGYGVAQVLRLASNLILTRLLAPSIFGAMALVQITLLGLNMFTDIGVGPSVMRAKDNDNAFLDTAWTIQFIRGWMLWIFCAALAWPMARFYHLPELRYFILASGFEAVLNGCQSMAMFTENKKLAIKNLVALSLVSQVIGISVMCVAAFYLRNVWALVIGALAGAGASSIGSYIFLPCRVPKLIWDKASANELFQFGKWIFVSTMTTFFASQLDRILLGKLVPLATLGIYSLAISLATLPNAIILRIASTILYPILTRHSDGDRADYVKKVLKARNLLLSIGLIIIAGLATIAPPFFKLLYDPRYADGAWMAQLLCLYVWFWMLQASADRALIALGDTRAVFISNFMNLLFTLLGCWCGYHWAGIVGFILGLSVSSLAGHVVVEISLLQHGINIVPQDLVATAAVTALVLIALATGRGAGLMFSQHIQMPVNWIVGNLVILIAGAGVAGYVKKVLRPT